LGEQRRHGGENLDKNEKGQGLGTIHVEGYTYINRSISQPAYKFYTVKYIMDSREGTDMVELAELACNGYKH